MDNKNVISFFFFGGGQNISCLSYLAKKPVIYFSSEFKIDPIYAYEVSCEDKAYVICKESTI